MFKQMLNNELLMNAGLRTQEGFREFRDFADRTQKSPDDFITGRFMMSILELTCPISRAR